MNGNTWRRDWPQGIDDGSDDETILHVGKGALKQPDSDPSIQYKYYRPAIPGQWPNKTIDDGTDDDTVVAAQYAEKNNYDPYNVAQEARPAFSVHL